MISFILAIIGGVFLGGAYFYRKKSTETLSGLQAFNAESLSFSIIVCVYLVLSGNLSQSWSDMLAIRYPIYSSILVLGAVLMIFLSVKHGGLAVSATLYTLTSLIVTIALSHFLLGESFSTNKLVGVVLALLAIYLLRS